MVTIYYTYKEKDASREFLFYLLKNHYNIDADENSLDYTKTGKISLKDSPLCFNISHSKGILAIAFSDEEVGLDVEKIRDKNHSSLSKKYFGTIPNSLEDFFKLWTKAESFVKYKAGSIVCDLKDIALDGDKVYFKDALQDVKTKTFVFDEYVFSITQQNDFKYILTNSDF